MTRVGLVARSRLALGLLWAVGVLAAGLAGLLGHMEGYERAAELGPHTSPCAMPPLPAGYPEQPAITIALVVTTLIFAIAAALRFRRFLLPLALLQLGVSALLVLVGAESLQVPSLTSDHVEVCERVTGYGWPVVAYGWAVRGLVFFGAVVVAATVLVKLAEDDRSPDRAATARRARLRRAVIAAWWFATAAATVVAALHGWKDGFSRAASITHVKPCGLPPLPAAFPDHHVVLVAAVLSTLLFVTVATQRFRRWLLAGAIAQALVSLWLWRFGREPRGAGYDPLHDLPCNAITGVTSAVDAFRTSLLVAVVAGPVLLLLVAIMRLRQPRPDPPLPPPSVRRRLWDLLR